MVGLPFDSSMITRFVRYDECCQLVSFVFYLPIVGILLTHSTTPTPVAFAAAFARLLHFCGQVDDGRALQNGAHFQSYFRQRTGHAVPSMPHPTMAHHQHSQ